jgi:hypothetical protein
MEDVIVTEPPGAENRISKDKMNKLRNYRKEQKY